MKRLIPTLFRQLSTNTRISSTLANAIREGFPDEQIFDLIKKEINPKEIKSLIDLTIAHRSSTESTLKLIEKADEQKALDKNEYKELLRFTIIMCKNQPEIILKTLEQLEKISPLTPNEYGELLTFSIKHLSPPIIISTLLEKGANVEKIEYGQNSLLIAIESGTDTKVISLLLERGAKIDFKNSYGQNYLHHVATQINHATEGNWTRRELQTAAVLLLKDPDIAAHFDTKDKLGNRPIDLITDEEKKNLFTQIVKIAQEKQKEKIFEFINEVSKAKDEFPNPSPSTPQAPQQVDESKGRKQ